MKKIREKIALKLLFVEGDIVSLMMRAYRNDCHLMVSILYPIGKVVSKLYELVEAA